MNVTTTRTANFEIKRPTDDPTDLAWPDLSNLGASGKLGPDVYVQSIRVNMSQQVGIEGAFKSDVSIAAYGVQRKKDGTPGMRKDSVLWHLHSRWLDYGVNVMLRWIFDLVNEQVSDFLAGDVVFFDTAVAEWAKATAGVTA